MNLSHLSKDATILAMLGAEPGKSASDMTAQEREKAAKAGTAKMDDAIAQKLTFGAFWKVHESHLWEPSAGGQQQERFIKFRSYYNYKIYTWRKKQDAAAHAAAAAAAAALATLAHDGSAAAAPEPAAAALEPAAQEPRPGPNRANAFDMMMPGAHEPAPAQAVTLPKQLVECARDRHAFNLAKMIGGHIKVFRENKSKGTVVGPYDREMKPCFDSTDPRDYIGTKAFFWDPELAGVRVTCLCGQQTAPWRKTPGGSGAANHLQRHGYTARRVFGRDGCTFLVGVRYICRHHDSAAAEIQAARLKETAGDDYFYRDFSMVTEDPNDFSLDPAEDESEAAAEPENESETAAEPEEPAPPHDNDGGQAPTCEEEGDQYQGLILVDDGVDNEPVLNQDFQPLRVAPVGAEAPKGGKLAFTFMNTCGWARQYLGHVHIQSLFPVYLTRKTWVHNLYSLCVLSRLCLHPHSHHLTGKGAVHETLVRTLIQETPSRTLNSLHALLKAEYHGAYGQAKLRFYTAMSSIDGATIDQRIKLGHDSGLVENFPP